MRVVYICVDYWLYVCLPNYLPLAWIAVKTDKLNNSFMKKVAIIKKQSFYMLGTSVMKELINQIESSLESYLRKKISIIERVYVWIYLR